MFFVPASAPAGVPASLGLVDVVLWVVLPYIVFTVLVVGLVWRYKTDQYGWTSRSSQWNEPTILRWASPLFHFGVLFVFLGHVMGLAVPKSFTSAVGVSEHAYHLMATIPGTIAGLMTVVGLVAPLSGGPLAVSCGRRKGAGPLVTRWSPAPFASRPILALIPAQ